MKRPFLAWRKYAARGSASTSGEICSHARRGICHERCRAGVEDGRDDWTGSPVAGDRAKGIYAQEARTVTVPQSGWAARQACPREPSGRSDGLTRWHTHRGIRGAHRLAAMHACSSACVMQRGAAALVARPTPSHPIPRMRTHLVHARQRVHDDRRLGHDGHDVCVDDVLAARLGVLVEAREALLLDARLHMAHGTWHMAHGTACVGPQATGARARRTSKQAHARWCALSRALCDRSID